MADIGPTREFRVPYREVTLQCGREIGRELVALVRANARTAVATAEANRLNADLYALSNGTGGGAGVGVGVVTVTVTFRVTLPALFVAVKV